VPCPAAEESGGRRRRRKEEEERIGRAGSEGKRRSPVRWRR
jgi:hypothetical protein